ncbi:MAG: RES family NAD+ phosphorylase [Anaerolineales bacterium]
MTLRAWRIVKARYAESAFSGEGARLYGGRWNSPGVPVVYAAQHQSLAVLEVLVGLEDAGLLPRFVLFRVEFDEKLVETLADAALPRDWRANPPPRSTQRLGDAWAVEGRSAVLSVPSAVVPAERVYLLNPRHPDFGALAIEGPYPYAFDPRLGGK